MKKQFDFLKVNSITTMYARLETHSIYKHIVKYSNNMNWWWLKDIFNINVTLLLSICTLSLCYIVFKKHSMYIKCILHIKL